MDTRGYKEFLNSSGYRTVYKQMTCSASLKEIVLFLANISPNNVHS